MAASRSCVFCLIAASGPPGTGKPETPLVYTDPSFVSFRDRRPAAKAHFLVIPRAHFRSLNQLTKEDVPMVRKMQEIGYQVLRDNGADMSDTLVGFHWPLFTVGHLHLHAISPTNQMNWLQKLEFSSILFGDVDKALEALEKRQLKS